MPTRGQSYVDSIKSTVNAIGMDHIGIGSDKDPLSCRPGQGTDNAYPNLTGGFFKAAVAQMLHQGFTFADIAKVGGGNFCRVFDKATTNHA